MWYGGDMTTETTSPINNTHVEFDGFCVHCNAGIDYHGGEFWTTGYEPGVEFDPADPDAIVNNVCPVVGTPYSHEPGECATCGALYGEMGHSPEPCEPAVFGA